MHACLHTTKEKNLTYYKIGNGNKFVVLLHGWGASAKLMFPIVKVIGEYTYLVPDLYGHGLTPHPDTPLAVTDYVDGVMDIIKEEKIDSAIFICHSFGGRLGVYIASHYPKLVDRLILCNSAGLRPKRGLKYYIKRANFIIRRKLGLNADGCGSSEYRALDRVMKRTFSNVVTYYQDNELGGIVAPTLIVWGGKDRVTPPYMARRFYKNIPNSRLCIFKKVGHFSYAEDLKTFKKVVVDFLEN